MSQNFSEIPCDVLQGVGSQLSENLKAQGIHSLEDLLLHLPIRYQDKTRLTPIQDLREGSYAVIEGVIQKTSVTFSKKRSLLCEIMDQSLATVTMRLFYFSEKQRTQLCEGSIIRLFGLVRLWRQTAQIIHPEYRLIDPNQPISIGTHLTAIYPNLPGFSQTTIRKLIQHALAYLAAHPIEEHVPSVCLSEKNFMSLPSALNCLHQPTPDLSVDYLNDPNHPARQRLAFEELLAQRLALRQARQIKQLGSKATSMQVDFNVVTPLIESFPFDLTNAQLHVLKEIFSDLIQCIPMQRLLQGDVGSGKTIIAILTAFWALKAGKQIAVMAPTEILATQLYEQFKQYLLEVKITFLAGSTKSKTRCSILKGLQSGEIKIIIGTHALFQSDVVYADLGLMIIDEQHRFGVKQRLALQEKNSHPPHQLIMTATPIPRSLAMTAYADLELSVLDELPPGRKAVQTVAIDNERRLEVIARIQALCQTGHQTYWVCTLIEESEALQCQTAIQTVTALKKHLPKLTIALVHGQMSASEKSSIMTAFKANKIQLLVATTVIEVGVNVPNATLMIIENSERLGLAQLHQLRGRVGRDTAQSYCVLLYQNPLTTLAQRRLQIMRQTHDGFEIAEEDLKIRGPGDFLGTQQTGVACFKVACMIAHRELLPEVKRACEQIEVHAPDKIPFLIKRWYRQSARYVGV